MYWRWNMLASALITLPAAIAVPYFTETASEYQQQPFSLPPPPPPARSPWRTFSEYTWGRVWRSSSLESATTPDVVRDVSRLPTSRHEDDIVVRFNYSSSLEASALADVARYMYLDVWDSTQAWTDIRLSKQSIPHVLKQLPESMQHSHTALLQERELRRAIHDTYPLPRKAIPLSKSDSSAHGLFTPSLNRQSSAAHSPDNNIFFSDYQPLSVIAPWMRLLSSLFTSHVRLINIGLTHEGRDIPAFRVGVHPTNNEDPFAPPRKTVLVMGGIHAREWISVSTVSYLAYSMITSYGHDTEITQLLEDFDWIFIPTINPDGYVYTWETDRLWRKNRQSTPLRFCPGIDLDRSFPYQWDDSTAHNPCSESYAGDAPLQGVEAQALADWMRNETLSNGVDFVAMLDLHSYSQQILWPYSYSCEAYPPGLENLEELALGLSKAIRINSGHSFIAKQACEGNVAFAGVKGMEERVAFESTGGSALDYIYHDLNVKYAYQIKLRDRGAYGFLLPKEHIVPSGKEILEAALYLGRYIDGEYEGRGRKGRLRSQAGW